MDIQREKLKTWHDYFPEFDIKDFLLNIPTDLSMKVKEYANRNGKILEVGVGRGFDSIYLSYFDYCVVGIDTDPIIVERAVRLNTLLKAKANFLQMDAFSLGFKDGSFDVIFHQGVLEHYNEGQIKDLLKEQLRVANLVIFSVPTDRFVKVAPKEWIFGNENSWSIKKWLNILKDFKIVEIFGGGKVMITKLKRFKQNLLYLPFWVFNENIWQRKYLSYCTDIGFVLMKK